MDLHGAGNGAHRARAHTVFARSLKRRLAQLGMRGQPKIIIGGEIDDLLAVEGAHRLLFVFEDAQLEVGAFILQLVELVGEIGELGAGGGDGHAKSSISMVKSGQKVPLGMRLVRASGKQQLR